jgi:hypothetical protein
MSRLVPNLKNYLCGDKTEVLSSQCVGLLPFHIRFLVVTRECTCDIKSDKVLDSFQL